MHLLKIYRKLLGAYGKQGWWPTARNGKTGYYGGPASEAEQLEVCIGAILAQNTSWKNAENALVNLRSRGLSDVAKIANTPHSKLGKAVRSAGFFNQKSERLKIFCSHIQTNYNGSLGKLLAKDVKELRNELLKLKGIGNETADTIILYAAGKPVFVIDAYTRKIFSSLGFLDIKSGYDGWRKLFEENLPVNADLFKEFHALIVEHGKRLKKGGAISLS